MSKLRSGMPIFEVRWDVFRQDWTTADPSRRVVLDDGRPAVRSATGGSYETLPESLWAVIRSWFRPDGAADAPRKRERRCQACNTVLHLTHEYEHAWTFTCPVCRSAEAFGKSLIGGTPGAGEREKR